MFLHDFDCRRAESLVFTAAFLCAFIVTTALASVMGNPTNAIHRYVISLRGPGKSDRTQLRIFVAPAVLDRLSHDFCWHSPVLCPLLVGKVAKIVAQPVSVEEVQAILSYEITHERFGLLQASDSYRTAAGARGIERPLLNILSAQKFRCRDI
ncbi:MAG TPA: hypothetical protein VFU68_03330 [Terracidiphilus sp.]|nr:hypothetical protein [Terracidiphilus sp.]